MRQMTFLPAVNFMAGFLFRIIQENVKLITLIDLVAMVTCV